MTTANLLWSLLFSSLGFAYFVYGKRQQRLSALLAGVGLMVYPYFVPNTLLLVILGAALSAVPFVIAV